MEDAHEQLVAILSARPQHIGALRNASRYVVGDDHVFVHAGLRPGIRITDKDIRTIRSDFLTSGYDFGRTVVHGHTETTSGRPEVHGNRIALNTGACAPGVLSTLVIEQDRDNRFLATRPSARGVDVLDGKPVVFSPWMMCTSGCQTPPYRLSAGWLGEAEPIRRKLQRSDCLRREVVFFCRCDRLQQFDRASSGGQEEPIQFGVASPLEPAVLASRQPSPEGGARPPDGTRYRSAGALRIYPKASTCRSAGSPPNSPRLHLWMGSDLPRPGTSAAGPPR